jgi:hypothetical protein
MNIIEDLLPSLGDRSKHILSLLLALEHPVGVSQVCYLCSQAGDLLFGVLIIPPQTLLVCTAYLYASAHFEGGIPAQVRLPLFILILQI